MTTIGIISPSSPFDGVDNSMISQALSALEKKGIKTRLYTEKAKLEEFYAANAGEADILMASSGGFDCIELLPHLDFSRISKPLCGYSDTTVLLNAVLAKTGKIQFLGPSLRSLGNQITSEIMIDDFIQTAIKKQKNVYQPSDFYIDGHFDCSVKLTDSPLQIVNKGEASGILVGGNLCSQILLMAAGLYPVYDNMIILAEEDDMNGIYTANMFFRNLYGLFTSAFASHIKGLIIGRFQRKSSVDESFAAKLHSLDFLKNIPVVINFDTGHTLPIKTVPLGTQAEMSACNKLSLIF